MGNPRIKTAFTRKKQLEQDLKHVNEEMYKRNLELAQTNRTLSLLRAIDTLVLESHDSLQMLCQQIASSIAQNSDYTFVAIFSKDTDHPRLNLSGLGMQGVGQNDPMTPRAFLDNDSEWFSQDSTTKLVALSPEGSAEFAKALHMGEFELKQLLNLTKAETVYLIKLTSRQSLVGLMVVGFAEKLDQLPDDDVELIQRLSEAVGVAVDNRLLYEENLQVLKKLQRSNEKLKAMDETKDEFISMASHQLRTPLTSVKGYLSMVLEGDAGKITASQKKLLDQAFVSSQRMVYLIADLLNVSRLRTGKFVIDAVPTNLAEAVAGEVAQLRETAAGRGLKLEYKQPAKFPSLMLDETKIRQVIMNFTDNAIYYTPSGGKIVVKVEDKPDVVEFTVTDNGIGVPKSEQHNLFTKFYRAGNARKARPDGTGLGLFMAKKVIVAQGGTLIFSSTEGKGSTFGFSFAKSKLKVPENT